MRVFDLTIRQTTGILLRLCRLGAVKGRAHSDMTLACMRVNVIAIRCWLSAAVLLEHLVRTRRSHC